MKKSNSKVDARTINFTQLVYNNCTINVNTDNSNNNKLKNLRNNLLYIIECCLLIISIVATIFSLIIIAYDLILNKQIPYIIYVLLPTFIGTVSFLIKNCNH